MSLIPRLLLHPGRPSPLLGQGLTLEDLYAMTLPIRVSDYYRPVRRADGHDARKFQVCLDVHQFSSEEIKVKTVGRQIVVTARHEERADEHGRVERHFVRKYALPEGYEPHEVVAQLSSDGVLSVSAPRDPIVLPDKDERIVPVTQTGPHHRGGEVREHSVEHEHEAREHKDHKDHKEHPPQKDDPQEDKKEENAVPLAIKYI